MRCERCGKRDATVHFTQVEGEEVVQRHLCDACAAECDRFQDQHCRACADECRRCADECRKMTAM